MDIFLSWSKSWLLKTHYYRPDLQYLEESGHHISYHQLLDRQLGILLLIFWDPVQTLCLQWLTLFSILQMPLWQKVAFVRQFCLQSENSSPISKFVLHSTFHLELATPLLRILYRVNNLACNLILEQKYAGMKVFLRYFCTYQMYLLQCDVLLMLELSCWFVGVKCCETSSCLSM